ncbi:unnamed protein product [Prunus armeniaca]|uniref:Integrase catalytic domain-containing protein n=1 Tax=Prunus armeniaca TaxID=36596 RepID=A0A6J5X8T0_PRUAR|nr:unnamed protein product [Prunus armeniaca]
MDVLYRQELDMVLEDKPEDIDDKKWTRINLHDCASIRLFRGNELKYLYMKETSAKKLWIKLEEKYTTNSAENRLFFKKRLFRFQYRPANLDVKITDEDKALCLLNSLPDDYDHLTTTLLYGKSEVKLDEVSAALWRGKFPTKDECAFCRQKGHWKKVCPKLKNKEKEKAGSKANIAKYGDDDFEFALASSFADGHSKEWILDSGCTYHMCPIREWFSSFEELDGGVVLMGINNAYKTQGIGKICLKMHDGKGSKLLVEQLSPKLLTQIAQILRGLVNQGLLKGAKACKLEFSEHCVLGKQTRVQFGTAVHHTKGILDYVHTDVWGPSKNASWGRSHYFVSFVDDFSRRIWVYTMKRKDEVLKIFLKWKNMIETQSGGKIKTLISDNGGEYKSEPFLKVCQDEGIVRHFTVKETPQQNGVAERMNRTLLEKVR